MTRWDCSNVGHAERYSIRRDGVEFYGVPGRHCWWPVVSLDGEWLAWNEHDALPGMDPGSPVVNNSPCVDVRCIHIATSAALRTLARGMYAPHPEWSPEGVGIRRIGSVGWPEVAIYAPDDGAVVRVHASRRDIVDQSYTLEWGWVWRQARTITGDELLPVTMPTGLAFHDPARMADGRLVVLVEHLARTTHEGRWSIGYAWPFPVFMVPRAPDVLLGPPRFTADGRILFPHAIARDPQAGGSAWLARSVAADRSDEPRVEWSDAGGHVRFPFVA